MMKVDNLRLGIYAIVKTFKRKLLLHFLGVFCEEIRPFLIFSIRSNAYVVYIIAQFFLIPDERVMKEN